PLAANVVAYKGVLAACKTSGFFGPATGDPTEVVVGRFYESRDNTGGADGAVSVDVQFFRERNLLLLDNAAGTNTLHFTDRERICSVFDDHTVGAHSGDTQSDGGIVYDVTAEGV